MPLKRRNLWTRRVRPRLPIGITGESLPERVGSFVFVACFPDTASLAIDP